MQQQWLEMQQHSQPLPDRCKLGCIYNQVYEESADHPEGTTFHPCRGLHGLQQCIARKSHTGMHNDLVPHKMHRVSLVNQSCHIPLSWEHFQT